MDVKRLITLTFEKNVGTLDRGARLFSGAGLIAAAWSFNLPPWAALGLTLFGVMWTMTGVLSRCSIYYALGYSTCPISGAPNPRRPPGA